MYSGCALVAMRLIVYRMLGGREVKVDSWVRSEPLAHRGCVGGLMYSPTISTTLSANAADLECLQSMCAQICRLPDLAYLPRCHVCVPGHQLDAPVCGLFRDTLRCQEHHPIERLLRDDCRAPRARTFQQALSTLSFKPISPSMYRLCRRPLCCGNLGGRHPFTELQNDLRAHDLTVRQRRGPTPFVQSCCGLLGDTN